MIWWHGWCIYKISSIHPDLLQKSSGCYHTNTAHTMLFLQSWLTMNGWLSGGWFAPNILTELHNQMPYFPIYTLSGEPCSLPLWNERSICSRIRKVTLYWGDKSHSKYTTVSYHGSIGMPSDNLTMYLQTQRCTLHIASITITLISK